MEVAAVWPRGSVIASWLLDLTATALARDPTLAKCGGRVSDSGEGRWTIKAAIDEGVPAPVLTTALYKRFSSRRQADFSDRLLPAMRYEFGGHLEKALQSRISRKEPVGPVTISPGSSGALSFGYGIECSIFLELISASTGGLWVTCD